MVTAPRAVQAIAERLESAGFETWCVGGAVRDALLGHPHLDWDLATAATPAQVRKLFRRTVPVGLDFGTVGVLDDAGVMHEVTTFRRDVQTDGRHAVVEFGVSLNDDLARRDFTMNAIAVSPRTGEVRDPFGGRQDLERKVVRAVGVPDERMREDRLRALRAIRFAARLEFDIDGATWDAIVASAPHLGRLSRERVKQEIEKTMEQVRCPSRALYLWRDSGALDALVPALRRSDRHEEDIALASADHVGVPARTRRVERIDLRRRDRIAATLMGLAPSDVRATLHDLRFSNADVRAMQRLAEHWSTLFDQITRAMVAGARPSNVEIRRWAAVAGRTQTPELWRLFHARWTALRHFELGAPSSAASKAVYRRALRIAYRDPIELADLAVDGDDLQREGIARGPALGKILRSLLEWVVEDPSRNTRDQGVARARALAKELEEGSSNE
jgi:tRNA nucleotidyltransferase (CCA-adding enzyme)